MPNSEVLKINQTISTATGLKDPTNFCQILCASRRSHYFAVKVNKTCQCIDKVPLGGNYGLTVDV